jgi:cob(I)alamin adenosyltransferase
MAMGSGGHIYFSRKLLIAQDLAGTRRGPRYDGGMARHGLLMVFTGNGKGKTTAAVGTAFRAAGQGFRTLMIQFIKGSWPTGESDAAPLLGGKLEIRPMGRGFVSVAPAPVAEEDKRLALEAWNAAVEAIRSRKYDILILDEIVNVIDYGMLALEPVLAELKARPGELHVICTGRNAPPELVDAADLVTEMREIKHPFYSGVPAQRGIEY